MRKNIKKLKNIKRKKQQEQRRVDMAKNPIIFDFKDMLRKENFWQIPFMHRNDLVDNLAMGMDFDEGCNSLRMETIPMSLNWAKHTSYNRKNLAKYAGKYIPVYWQALVSNLAIKNGRGFLLLDKVVQIDPESKDIWVGFKKDAVQNFFDYHMWLPLSNIKYFGNVDKQEIAQGDAIQGVSYVFAYGKDDHVSYGFGATHILNCGLVLGDDYLRTLAGYKMVNGKFINDYSRLDNLLVRLSYSEDYKIKLNRYHDKSLLNLSKLRGGIKINMHPDNQVSYDERFECPM